MPFGVVSGVGSGTGVLDGVHVPQGEGKVFWGGEVLPIRFNGLLSVFFKQKCIRLVHKKLTIFSYRQYIIGIIIYSSFLKYTFYEKSAEM